MMMTGEPVSATDAYNWGLVDRVVPRTGLAEATTEWVTAILGSAPLAVQTIKELVDTSATANSELIDAEAKAIARIQRTADAAEGTRAFLERRPPAWCGK
jgi:enoyl-CoA hydratase/carnithine racemase